MDDAISIRISEADFDLQHEYDALAGRLNVGAVVSFVGRARGSEALPGGVNKLEHESADAESALLALQLEHYPDMTENVIRDICRQAFKKWQLVACRVVHRIGRIAVGEQIVLVLVSASHRQDAFAACEFIMDFLKTEAPFWKKALRRDGAHWIQAKDSDQQALDKWQH